MLKISRFQKNMNYGHAMEKLVLPYLGDFAKCEFAPRNRSFKDYDIKLTLKDDSIETYEIKCDRCCFRTGNFFVKVGDELNRPAGLRTSKADCYCFIKVDALDVIQCVYIIDTQSLRDLEIENQFRKMGPFNGAENYGFLLPEKILEYMAEENYISV